MSEREGPVPMVLAAGHATRLRPLTAHRAKAIVPFLNRPVLDYTLDWLRRQGHRRVVVNLHHAGGSIRDTYGSLAFGMQVQYSEESVLLGTGGGPRAALDLLGPLALLVNGDVVTQAATGPLLRTHRALGAVATLGLHAGPPAAGYPHCVASDRGRLVAFPPAAPDLEGIRGVFTGVHVVQRELLEAIPAGEPCGIVDPVYREVLAAGEPLGATTLAGAWYEVGDPARYIGHQLESLRRGDLPLALRGLQRLLESGYVDRNAHLENLRMASPFLVGAGARIKHGAAVHAAVIGDRVRVGAGTRLHRCIVWPDSWIGPRCELENVVVMSRARVMPGTAMADVVFTPEGPVSFADEEGA